MYSLTALAVTASPDLSHTLFLTGGAHWPTKENRQHFGIFWIFPAHAKKWAGRAPNGAGRFFFRLIKTSPTFWAERILILIIFISWIFLGPKFLAWAQAQARPKAQAWPRPGLEIWKSENPKNLKNINSQNQNTCRPKCRQGLD